MNLRQRITAYAQLVLDCQHQRWDDGFCLGCKAKYEEIIVIQGSGLVGAEQEVTRLREALEQLVAAEEVCGYTKKSAGALRKTCAALSPRPITREKRCDGCGVLHPGHRVRERVLIDPERCPGCSACKKCPECSGRGQVMVNESIDNYDDKFDLAPCPRGCRPAREVLSGD